MISAVVFRGKSHNPFIPFRGIAKRNRISNKGMMGHTAQTYDRAARFHTLRMAFDEPWALQALIPRLLADCRKRTRPTLIHIITGLPKILELLT